jgi:CxxC motif-containing protein (DUF1111 family)
MLKHIITVSIIGLILLMVACQKLLPGEPKQEDILGAPLEGLTPQQLKNHIKGDAEFGRMFAEADGLGPIFVANSCESCHIADGKGHPLTTLTRFCKYTGTGYDPMVSVGGPQLQHRCISGYTAEVIPQGVTGSSKFLPPAVAGLGFLAAVADADLLAMVDSNDVNGDGISGVPNYIYAPSFFIAQSWHTPVNGKYIGRFGRKAGAIDLLQQTANAYLNDIGITSDFNPQDLFNVQIGNYSGDNVPDPEVTASTVHNVVFYMRTLKAPPRRDQNNTDVIQGETIFTQVGCNKCHTSTLKTGTSEIEALSNKTFHPYTDLLLHDMGAELNDGYTEGGAKPEEWRTTPLWGLGISKNSQGGQYFLLHDGRAKSIQEAITFHGGEGQSSRNAFNTLSGSEKEKLIKFLESL